MIEFLSSESWITPQVNFLITLQNIRIEQFEFLNSFFLSITKLGEFIIPAIICSVIYWSVDSKAGLYLYSLFGFELLLSQFFKMLAGVYRPWILSNNIHPVDAAVPAAKGYSFPSGHSATSSSILGGLALLYRKKRLLCICLIITVLLVGFSRMWLGVHTPQDVVVGLTIGFSLIFIFKSIINWAEKNSVRYLYLLYFIDFIAIASIAYVCYFNTYPMDYINGHLLVNPHKSILSYICCYGYSLGFINGAFLCRHFAPFDASKGSINIRITRSALGTILTIILFNIVYKYVLTDTIHFRYALITCILAGLFLTLIYPILFTQLEKNTKLKNLIH